MPTTKWILVSSINSEAPKMSAEFDTKEELEQYVEHESFLNPTFYPIQKIEVPIAKEEYDFSKFNENPFKDGDNLLVLGTIRLQVKEKQFISDNLEQITIINDEEQIKEQWEEFTKVDPANDLQFQEMEEPGFKRAIYSSKVKYDNFAYKILIPLYPPHKEDPFDVIVILRRKAKADRYLEQKNLNEVKEYYSKVLNDIYSENKQEIEHLLTEQIEQHM